MIVTNTTLMTAGVIIPPTHAFSYARVTEMPELGEAEVESVRTERTYQFPVTQLLGISQGYHALHRGIDVRASKGTSVVSVAEGVVVEVSEQSYGYGKYVRIAHAGTMASLYAHLDTIGVEVGEKVSKGQEIGTVGTTGWSTGSHLHFELTEGDRGINPGEILNSKS